MPKFRALAERLSGPIAWCAGAHEPLPGAVKIENLYELARWVAGARVYIGNDAGITHLAAAVGAPVVAIFGPTDPARWAPRGNRVRIIAGDLQNITVDEVLAAVNALRNL
jgi:lipopolysaccharide heptosyltransferase III